MCCPKKFVDDKKLETLGDLGERMSLIHEYANNKVNQEQTRIIRNQLKHGMKAEVIVKTAEVPLSRVKAIERTLKK